MTDDKPTLTRRRVLGGMATIGVAGAVGAGTWAQMHDTETAEYTVTAGTLDLLIDGQDGPVQIEVGPVQNSEEYQTNLALTNGGNIAGKYLCIEITNLKSFENGRAEPEKDAGDTTGNGEGGELAEQLDIDTDIHPTSVEGFEYSQLDGVYGGTLDTLVGERVCFELPEPLGGSNNNVDKYIANVQISLDGDDISKAMGDSVTFDYNITLYDENPN